ncbi:MAG TPA: hypothetical protein VGN43_02225 [Steroidobacteraceae bacterium]|nr:hypothetical protein [Steroidobacteraceae bacterium]
MVRGLSSKLADPNHVDWLRRPRRSASKIPGIDRGRSRGARVFHPASLAVASKTLAIVGAGAFRIPWVKTRDLNVPEPVAVRIALER